MPWSTLVHLPCRLPDQGAEHRRLGVELGQRELDGLVRRQRLAEHAAVPGVRRCGVDAVLRGTERRRRLADPVLVHEQLGHLEPVVERRRAGRRRATRTFGERHPGVVGRHVERPEVLLDLSPPAVSIGTMKHEMPADSPSSPLVRAKTKSWVATCTPVFHIFSPLMTHSSPSRTGGGLHPRRVGAVVRLGEAEPDAGLAGEHLRDPLGLLGLGAVLLHHQHGREVADDRRLVLEVVEQPETLGGEVLADHRHVEVRPVRGRRSARAGGSGGSRRRRPRAASRPSSASHSSFGQTVAIPVGAGCPRVDGRRSARCRPRPGSGRSRRR